MATTRSRLLRVLLVALLLVALAGAGAAGALYWSLVRELPDFETLADYRPPLTTRVLDRHGESIGQFYEFRRRLTPLDRVPPVVIQAFLAAEDDTFYEHGGVDYVSILRAAWANFRAGGETVQGASTITQQMVKQLLLSPERTYTRKLRELVLARRIEQRFSKDEILFLYLNQIYFGSGAYGIGEAARTYFGEDVSEVDASEAALLAGLPKAPGRNSPFLDPQAAEERRRYVLERMHQEGFLDDAAFEQARTHPPALASTATPEAFAAASYFTEEVRKALVARLGNDAVLHGGLTVETTLDLPLQRDASAAVRAGLEALDRRQGYRGPLRSVASDALAAELETLGRENGLVVPASPFVPAAAEPPALPRERALLGVVTALAPADDGARVAFAPGREARVKLADAKWARRDPKARGEARSIDQVFAVGDVARFRVLPPDEKAEASAPPRAELYQEPLVQGALLSFDAHGGDVLALVGGYDFEDSEFNRATQARRQPGSAFKPIIYGAALGHGFTPATILYDRPVVYEDRASGFVWRPENYGRRFLGPLTMGEALARSVNNATIHLLADVGLDAVIDFARRLGIEAPLERNLGLALGVSPVSLLELTRAYGVFAGGGRRPALRFVARVLDRDGRVLLEDLRLDAQTPPEAGEPAAETPPAVASSALPATTATGTDPDQAIPPTQAYLTTALLRGVVENPKGTGRRARSLGRPLAGKTGTTNDQGDAWFMGFSPDVVTGVWVGFDEKRVLGHGETGGRAALPIWMDYMQHALADRPVRDFDVPEGIVFARIDAKSGLLATPANDDALFQAFLEGTEPRRRADAVEGTLESRRRLLLDF